MVLSFGEINFTINLVNFNYFKLNSSLKLTTRGNGVNTTLDNGV